MRKLLALSTALLALTSCSQSLQSITTSLRNFGKPKPVTVGKQSTDIAKNYDSLRQYLLRYTNKELPIGSDKTVVVARNLDSGVDANWNVIPKLYAFCKAHGGNLVAGSGMEEISYDVVNGKPEAMKYFGLGSTFRCEGGSYPFEVEHIKGRAGHYSSVLGWVAEALIFIKHKPEPMIHTKFAFPEKEMNAFSQMTLPQFISWARDEDEIVGDFLQLGSERWKGNLMVRKPVPSFVVRSMDDRMGFVWYALEYCQAQGGHLDKDGKPYEEWFTDFVKKDKLWGYPYDLVNGKAYPLAGLYACVGGNQPFEMEVKPRGFSGNYFYYSFVLESGNRVYEGKYGLSESSEESSSSYASESEGESESTGSSQPAETGSSQEYSTALATLSGGLLTKMLAAKAAALESDFTKQQGAVVYRVYYNGVDGNGCKLASVAVDNAGNVTVYNYRVCGNSISDYQDSTLDESVPEEVVKAEKEVAEKAKDYGKYSMEVNGYRIYGRALRDKDYCLVEVRVLDGIRLVKIDRVRVCE
jgi:putative hemolysin